MLGTFPTNTHAENMPVLPVQDFSFEGLPPFGECHVQNEQQHCAEHKTRCERKCHVLRQENQIERLGRTSKTQ